MSLLLLCYFSFTMWSSILLLSIRRPNLRQARICWRKRQKRWSSALLGTRPRSRLCVFRWITSRGSYTIYSSSSRMTPSSPQPQGLRQSNHSPPHPLWVSWQKSRKFLGTPLHQLYLHHRHLITGHQNLRRNWQET